MIVAHHRGRRRAAFTLSLIAVAALGACGGGGSDDPVDGTNDVDESDESDEFDGAGLPDADAPAVLLPGDIARYGIVTVADSDGVASDVVGGFFELDDSVSPEAFGGALDPDTIDCRVSDVNEMDFATVTGGFLPMPAGTEATSVDAGDTLVLSSAAGTWAELQPGSVASFRFYDLPAGGTLPAGAVPADLVAAVPGGGEFPAFDAAAFPSVQPLVGFDTGESIGADARFTWQASDVPGSKLRISTSTAGAFFAGAGVRVTCSVPDTGSFSFPNEVREALGADFEGDPVASSFSRTAIATTSVDDALLILVRESAAVD